MVKHIKELIEGGDALATIDDILNSLTSTITEISKKGIKEADFSSTVKCVVTEVNGNEKYTVKVSGVCYTAKSHFTHNVNDVVYVLKPQGKWKDLIIVY